MKKVISFILAMVMMLSMASMALAADVSDFTDVKKGDWFYEYVDKAAKIGLTEGTSGSTFSPQGDVTRGQFITMLYRHYWNGKNAPAVYTGKFIDVPEGKFYTYPVYWAAEAGIVNGISANEFDPESPVTREQAATMLYNYAMTLDLKFDTAQRYDGQETYDNMEKEICEILDTISGQSAVQITDLLGDSITTINSEKMQAASLIKLFIAGCVYEDIGLLKENGYTEDKIESYMKSMITVSDNNAANELTKMLGNGIADAGRDRVNKYCDDHGYKDTHMGRMLLASNAKDDNYTSVADCNKFLSEVYSERIAGAASISSYMLQQQRRAKLPAGIPETVKVGNKTGELTDVENDAAIVYLNNRPYVITVMTQNLSNASAARNAIVKISTVAYTCMNEMPKPLYMDMNLVSDYAKEAVIYLTRNGIVQGSYGYFHPLNKMTRAECVAMLVRFMELIGDDFNNDNEGQVAPPIATYKFNNLVKTDGTNVTQEEFSDMLEGAYESVSDYKYSLLGTTNPYNPTTKYFCCASFVTYVYSNWIGMKNGYMGANIGIIPSIPPRNWPGIQATCEPGVYLRNASHVGAWYEYCNASDKWSDVVNTEGKSVDELVDELSIGSVLFFGTKLSKIPSATDGGSHIGIYAGNGYIYHCGSKGVEKALLSDLYDRWGGSKTLVGYSELEWVEKTVSPSK